MVNMILCWAFILFLFYITQNIDDDDDPEGGMMVPSYQRS